MEALLQSRIRVRRERVSAGHVARSLDGSWSATARPVLPTPYNEELYQWVAQESWIYETNLMLPKDVDKTQTTLVFETLDGVAQVLVNGKQVAATANSFVPYRIEV